jgi:hypothetical protein
MSAAANGDPVPVLAPPANTPEKTVALPSLASGAASTAVAAEPARSQPAAPSTTPVQAPPRHNAPVLLLLLFLAVVLGIAAFVFNRPKSTHVLILTPEASSVTVASGSTASLGVGVEGAPDELVWSVEEKNSGRVEPAGVTVQGSKLIYHAIYHAPLRAGSYHIIAASRENKEQAATIQVDVRGK